MQLLACRKHQPRNRVVSCPWCRQSKFAFASTMSHACVTLYTAVCRADVQPCDSDLHRTLVQRGRGAASHFQLLSAGEPLMAWMRRTSPDALAILAMLSQVARALATLHAEGIVHCAVAPHHILWYPDHNSWALLDLSHATPVGQQASAALIWKYVAPECVSAAGVVRSTVAASVQLDAWALGIIGLELLPSLGQHARCLTTEQVRSQPSMLCSSTTCCESTAVPALPALHAAQASAMLACETPLRACTVA
jgi:Protein kinase domain